MTQLPIHDTASHNHLHVVQALVAAEGVDINIANADGSTPVHHAVFYNHLEVIQDLFVTKRIDINEKDQDGDAPLVLAVRGGQSGGAPISFGKRKACKRGEKEGRKTKRKA